MDTPRYDNLLRALAFKLRDPIAAIDGNADGKIFKLDSKTNYINRGYGAMRRKVGSIVSSPEKLFPDYYTIVEKTIPEIADGKQLISSLSISLSNIVANESVFDISDIYLSVYAGTTLKGNKQATWIDPESYIAAKYGASEVYVANDTAFQYFWSIINANIVFIAQEHRAAKAILFLKNATPQFEHAGSKDLVIPREYNDFLLTCAAYEAMIDLGDNKAIQKAVMYDKWLKNELEIMMIKEKIAKSSEDDRTTK